MSDLITNVVFLIVTIIFLGGYVFSLVLNLTRAIKTNKILKANPQYVEATITEVTKVKKRIYVKAQFISQSNHRPFDTVFELTENEFKDQYYVGQKLNIIYPKIEGTKQIHCFPVFLEGQKIKLEAGPIFTDSIMVAAGLFITIYSIFRMITTNAFKGGVPLISMAQLSGTEDAIPATFSLFNFVIFLVIYVVLISYLIERIIGISKDHSENYLKIYGLLVKAEVVTYKFTRTKNEKGIRQSQVKIAFSTNKGEKVEAEIYSFMYTENQEQYISILYDPRRPKMAVYLKG